MFEFGLNVQSDMLYVSSVLCAVAVVQLTDGNAAIDAAMEALYTCNCI